MDPNDQIPVQGDVLRQILMQLDRMNATLLTHEDNFARLQRQPSGESNEEADTGSAVGVGAQRQGASAPPLVNAPGGNTADNTGAATHQNAQPARQHGIRAVEPWTTTSALSKEPFCRAFK